MRIGIIAAMAEEKKLLEERMELTKIHKIAGWEFFEGKLANQEVIVVQSGIGKVMSAIATTLLIEKFGAGLIINTGSAGGLDKSLQIGDVVVASELAYSDVDVTAFGYDYGQLPQMPTRYKTQDDFIEQTIKAAEETGLRATKGLIVTADSFIHRKDQLDDIMKHFPDVYATEMEGAAIAQVCHTFDVPCLVIRAMSDIPESGTSAVSFDEFIIEAGKKSAEMVCLLLQNIK